MHNIISKNFLINENKKLHECNNLKKKKKNHINANDVNLHECIKGNANDSLRALINNLFKESFYGKKKLINVLTAFFISHKNSVKTFLKWIVNQCPESTC